MNNVDDKELEKVNGGAVEESNMITCPKCGKRFHCYTNQVTYGSGCDEKKYWKCPNCGHEF